MSLLRTTVDGSGHSRPLIDVHEALERLLARVTADESYTPALAELSNVSKALTASWMYVEIETVKLSVDSVEQS